MRLWTHGATWLGGGRARFRVYAPDARRMALRFENASGDLALEREADGFWSATHACDAGQPYRFVIDDGDAVPDPASRAQQGDVDGPSLVVDPGSFRAGRGEWRGRPWHETVLLELHAGLLGGFEGVRAALPRIADQGFTAIELMPVAEFPGARNWGYDGVLPYAPDAAYGTPAQLAALVDDAHGLGLSVFLDVVYNHFGPHGNHLARYAKRFFRADRPTPWGPAIDFRVAAVRDFFVENAIWWLEAYGFDGLRLDAVHAIADRAFLLELARRVRTALGRGRTVHLVLENDDNDAGLLDEGAYDAQWNDDLHHALHVLLTGEREGYYHDYAHAPATLLARALGEGFIYQGEHSAHRGATRGTSSAHLAPTAFVGFLQNHDQIGNRALGERLATLADPRALRAARALLLLSPHVPMLFHGDEHGARSPFLYFTDHPPGLAEAVREGRRREFASFPAFADPQRRERIPDPNAQATFEASRAHPQDADVATEIRALLALRRTELLPRLAKARALGAEAIGDAAIRARWRLGDGAEWTLAINLGDRGVAFAAPAGHRRVHGIGLDAGPELAPLAFGAWCSTP